MQRDRILKALTFVYPRQEWHRQLIHAVDAKKWEEGFFLACSNGHLQAVKLLIHQPVDVVRQGCRMACEHRHVHVFEYILRIPNIYPNLAPMGYLNQGLSIACYTGFGEGIKCMIRRGATNWNLGLVGACGGNKIDVAKDMIQRGATNMDRPLWYTCLYGHVDMVKFLLEAGAKLPDPSRSVKEISLDIQFLLWQKGHVQQLETTDLSCMAQLVLLGLPPSGFSDSNMAAQARLVWLGSLAISLLSSLPMPIIEWVILPYL